MGKNFFDYSRYQVIFTNIINYNFIIYLLPFIVFANYCSRTFIIQRYFYYRKYDFILSTIGR